MKTKLSKSFVVDSIVLLYVLLSYLGFFTHQQQQVFGHFRSQFIFLVLFQRRRRRLSFVHIRLSGRNNEVWWAVMFTGWFNIEKKFVLWINCVLNYICVKLIWDNCCSHHDTRKTHMVWPKLKCWTIKEFETNVRQCAPLTVSGISGVLTGISGVLTGISGSFQNFRFFPEFPVLSGISGIPLIFPLYFRVITLVWKSNFRTNVITSSGIPEVRNYA